MSADLLDLSWSEMTKGLPVVSVPVRTTTNNANLLDLSSADQSDSGVLKPHINGPSVTDSPPVVKPRRKKKRQDAGTLAKEAELDSICDNNHQEANTEPGIISWDHNKSEVPTAVNSQEKTDAGFPDLLIPDLMTSYLNENIAHQSWAIKDGKRSTTALQLQEKLVPALQLQEKVTPALQLQEKVTPALQLQEKVTPALQLQEVTPARQLQEKVTPALQLQEKVMHVKEKVMPVNPGIWNKDTQMLSSISTQDDTTPPLSSLSVLQESKQIKPQSDLFKDFTENTSKPVVTSPLVDVGNINTDEIYAKIQKKGRKTPNKSGTDEKKDENPWKLRAMDQSLDDKLSEIKSKLAKADLVLSNPKARSGLESAPVIPLNKNTSVKPKETKSSVDLENKKTPEPLCSNSDSFGIAPMPARYSSQNDTAGTLSKNTTKEGDRVLPANPTVHKDMSSDYGNINSSSGTPKSMGSLNLAQLSQQPPSYANIHLGSRVVQSVDSFSQNASKSTEAAYGNIYPTTKAPQFQAPLSQATQEAAYGNIYPTTKTPQFQAPLSQATQFPHGSLSPQPESPPSYEESFPALTTTQSNELFSQAPRPPAGYKLNGVLDVYIHAADIAKLHVDAVVLLSEGQDRAPQVVRMTDISSPCRYSIQSAISSWFAVQSDWSMLTSTCDNIWRSASNQKIRTIAIPVMKGVSPQIYATGVCKSLLNLSTLNSVDSSIKEVHVVGMAAEDSSHVIQMLVEATRSSRNKVTRIQNTEDITKRLMKQPISGFEVYENHNVEAPNPQNNMACTNQEYMIPIDLLGGLEIRQTDVHHPTYVTQPLALGVTAAQGSNTTQQLLDFAPESEYTYVDGRSFSSSHTGGAASYSTDTPIARDTKLTSSHDSKLEDSSSDFIPESEYAYVDSDNLGLAGNVSPELYEDLDEVTTPIGAPSLPNVKHISNSNAAPALPNRHNLPAASQAKMPVPSGFVTSAGCNIFLHTHDITKMKVDVIVSESKKHLEPEDKISKAAGQQLNDDLANIIAERGFLRETEVFETLGWKLPCKQVLHAICPGEARTRAEQLECLDLLQKTVKNVLDYTSDMGVTSMAIPLLGVDSRISPEHVSRMLCDGIIAKAKKLSHSGDAFPKEVHIISSSPDPLYHVISYFQTVFMPHDVVPMTELAIRNGLKHVCLGRTPTSNTGQRDLVHPAPSSSPSGSFEPRTFKVGLYSTVVLHVCDISLMAVDAIVCSDNSQLEHSEGVAGQIAEAAGQEMATFCGEIIDNQLTVSVSEVVQTPPGDLPCKLVLHTVGPDWPANNSPKEMASCLMQLKQTFDNIFEEARLMDIKSIAIPSISTGQNNIPIVHQSEKLYRAIVDNESRHQLTIGALREIHLVDTVPDALNVLVHLLQASYNDPVANNIKVAGADGETRQRIDKALSPPEYSETQADDSRQVTADHTARYVQSPGQVHSGQNPSSFGQQVPDTQYANVPHTVLRPAHQMVLTGITTPNHPVRFDEPVGYTIHDINLSTDVHIFLYNGSLATVKTDAVVNPTDSRLRHNHGVSRVLYSAAGPKFKEDGQKLIKTAKIPVTGVVSTAAGNLPCHVVLHAVPPKWPNMVQVNEIAPEHTVDIDRCMQKVTMTLQNIFSKALELGSVRTIALPTVCSAKAPIPLDYLTDNLFRFLLHEPNTRLFREIHIVEPRQEALGYLKAKFDSAIRAQVPDVLISRFSGDIGEVLSRVTDSADATDMYAEIPADSSATAQRTMSKKKTKIGKLTDRFTKLRPTKKQKDFDDGFTTGSVGSVAPPVRDRQPAAPVARHETSQPTSY